MKLISVGTYVTGNHLTETSRLDLLNRVGTWLRNYWNNWYQNKHTSDAKFNTRAWPYTCGRVIWHSSLVFELGKGCSSVTTCVWSYKKTLHDKGKKVKDNHFLWWVWKKLEERCQKLFVVQYFKTDLKMKTNSLVLNAK